MCTPFQHNLPHHRSPNSRSDHHGLKLLKTVKQNKSLPIFNLIISDIFAFLSMNAERLTWFCSFLLRAGNGWLYLLEVEGRTQRAWSHCLLCWSSGYAMIWLNGASGSERDRKQLDSHLALICPLADRLTDITSMPKIKFANSEQISCSSRWWSQHAMPCQQMNSIHLPASSLWVGLGFFHGKKSY